MLSYGQKRKKPQNRIEGTIDNGGNSSIFTVDEMNALFGHVQKVVAEKKANPNYTAALFCEGEYVTNEQMNDKKFLKLVNG